MINAAKLAVFVQPQNITSIQKKWLLSPNSLVFDRKEGFFRPMKFELVFADGETKSMRFVEAEREFSSYLERILIRRVFYRFASLAPAQYMFCNPISPILKKEKLQKKIVKVRINFQAPAPIRRELICPS